MARAFLLALCTALAGGVFVTVPASSAAAGACPNEALRTGPSAHLPDCRAYEQVTPVDKEGGLFEGAEFGAVGLGPGGAPSVMLESFTAIDGIKDDYLTYLDFRVFARLTSS